MYSKRLLIAVITEAWVKRITLCVMLGHLPAPGTVNTVKTDQEMVDYSGGGDDHNDNDSVVGKSLPVGNEAVEPLVEDISANLTVYVRVLKDPTGVLWHNFLKYAP